MWIPSEPLVFGNDSSPSRSSVSLIRQRDLDRLGEADVGRRVEVEEHPVGPRRLVDPRVPGVHVDAAHVHHPEQRELVVHEREVDHPALRRLVARRGLERPRRDPVGHVLRRVLLEEELALPPVRIALHRERPVAQVRQDRRRDVAVVGEQVALRDPLLRPERLVEVRELEHTLALPDLGARSPPARAARPPPPCPRAAPGRPAPAAGRRASTRRTGPRPRARARPRRRRPCARAASSAPRRTATSRAAAARSFASSRSISASSKPVPTLPAQRSPPPSLTASTSAPKRPARRPCPFVQPDDHELLPPLGLHLQPLAAAPARRRSASRPRLLTTPSRPCSLRRLEERLAVVERLRELHRPVAPVEQAPRAARAARSAAGRSSGSPSTSSTSKRRRGRAGRSPAASRRSSRGPPRRARHTSPSSTQSGVRTACSTARATDREALGERVAVPARELDLAAARS